MFRSLIVSFVLVAGVSASAWTLQRGGEPLVQRTPRESVRAVYFGGTGVASEYVVSYSPSQWRAEYEQGFDTLTLGKRLRLGRDYWTSLDNFGELQIGGKKVKSGYWFLALERGKKGDWGLVLLDDDEVRGRTMDAFASAQTTGGTVVPLTHEELEESADSLRIDLVPVEGKPKQQTLEIRFGPHLLKTTVES